MMKGIKIIFLCCALLGTLRLSAQSRVTVSGYITDAATGETLIGATVLSGPRTGAVTNPFGYYSLTLPAGETALQFGYIGYADEVRTLDLRRDTLLSIALQPSAVLDAAKVVSRSQARADAGIASAYLGSVDVPIKQIQNTPVLFGEADVLKALQKIPGVQGGNEGFTGILVRGGGPDENLILLDGTPIYNVDHMLGIFSVFQTEAVKKVTLYKGSFPARFGGRVSSIVDIRTNDGNLKEHSGSVTLGLLNSRLHLEGPIVKDRLSYSLSARGLHTFYIIPLLRLGGSDIDANYYFYDLNGKLTWRLSDSDRFYLGAYSGADRIVQNDSETDVIPDGYSGLSRDEVSTRWGNDVVHLRWNHVFSPRLFSNTTVAFNRYRMNLGSVSTSLDRLDDGRIQKDVYDVTYRSGIRDWNARTDFDWHPSPSRIVRFGGEYLYHTFKPEALTAVESTTTGAAPTETQHYDFQNRDAYNGHELSLYGEYEYTFPWNLTVDPGLRATLFAVDGRTYVSLQPRVNLKYDVPGVESLSLKTGYARMAQYVHLLSSLQISMPTDLWVPITKDIAPVTSDQVSAGIYYDGLPGWEFSVEGYFKWMDNILEFGDGVVMIGSSSNWEDRVEVGKGRARGLEFFAQKTAGDLTGWLSYTLAKSERRFPDGSINLGRWFPYKYDRRHSVNVNLSYKLTARTDLNAAWTYASGTPITVPERRTVITAPDGTHDEADYVPARNNYRLPASHHLDVSLSVHKQKARGERTWTFGVYNVYNRRNPNFYYLTDEQNNTNGERKLQLKTVSILPLIPSVSYTRTF